MAQNSANGRGAEIAVTTTATVEYVVPEPTNGGGVASVIDRLHIWNTGAADVRIVINMEDDVTGFDITQGILIPAGENDYIFGFRNPIKKFVHATESGTTTIKYSAN